MPQKQCPWCGHLGPRYCTDRESVHYTGDEPLPVDDHKCVCTHITCQSRRSAIVAGGRYFDGKRWVCLGSCYTAPPLTDEEIEWAESVRTDQ